MNKNRSFLERLADTAGIADEPLPAQPVVELAGDHRLLVENHRGVIQCTQERIGIRVRYGTVCVCGSGLHLAFMSRERLIICGEIRSLTLMRR